MINDQVIDGLAVFRLSRLITTDTFPPIQHARDALWKRFPRSGAPLAEKDGWDTHQGTAVRWFGFGGLEHRVKVAAAATAGRDGIAVALEAHPIGELFDCPWCISIWVAFGVLAARRYVPSVWDPIARALAWSAVAGVLASHT